MKQRRKDGDDGFSLVELLIAMALTTTLLAAVGTVVTGSLNTSRQAMSRVTSTADVRIAMEAMTRRLRVATLSPIAGPSFEIATTSHVRFWASLAVAGTNDPPPTLVDFDIDSAANCLRQTLTEGTDVRTLCLAWGDVSKDGRAAFTYYDDGSTTTPLPVDFLGALAPASLDNIVSVELSLAVQGTAGGVDAATVRAVDRVWLVNLAHRLAGGA